MRRGIHFLALALSTSCLAQETYKCSTPTGIVYQDRPCAGTKSTLKVETSSQPAASPQDAGPMDREKFYLEGRRIDKKRAVIADLQQELVGLQRTMASEISPLRQQWEEAKGNPNTAREADLLLIRMSSVYAKYQPQIAQKQEQIWRLRQELGLR